MTNITKAAQQALEALESLVHNTPYDGRYSDAIIHLRAALQDKAGEVMSEGLIDQHNRDSAELRRLCQSRDDARRERDIARAELAGLDASIGHLSRILSAQQALIEETEMLLATDDFGTPLEDGDSELLDKIRNHIAAFGSSEAQPAPVVPDGFALVPVEATAAMIQAGIDEMPHFTDEPGPVWSAMIAASQQKGATTSPSS